MSKIPTAEEYANSIYQEYPVSKEIHELMIEFTKLHVEAALEEVNKNISLDRFYPDGDEEASYKLPYTESDGSLLKLNENSILTAYPLTNIK
jgi:hypothetical protein